MTKTDAIEKALHTFVLNLLNQMKFYIVGEKILKEQ